MSQNHFTLSFSLKLPADAKALAEQLPPLKAAAYCFLPSITAVKFISRL